MDFAAALDLDPGLLVWIVSMSLIASFVQGSIGFGYAIVSVPILVLVDPRLAPAPQLIQMLPLSLAIYYRERKHADWKGVAWTTLARFPGTWMGVVLLAVATQRTLDLIIGGSVLAAVFLLTGNRSIPRNPWTESVAGALSGAGAVVSSIGGPPIALLYKDAKGPEVRATLSLIFTVGLAVTIGGRVIAGEMSTLDVSLGLITVPIVAVGFWVSRLTAPLMEGRRLQVAILGVSALSAILLIGRALFIG